MRVLEQKEEMPVCWRRAEGILGPKEKDSSELGKPGQIKLLNVEGKLFFSVLAHGLVAYLQRWMCGTRQCHPTRKEPTDPRVVFLLTQPPVDSLRPHESSRSSHNPFQGLLPGFPAPAAECTTELHHLEVGIKDGRTITTGPHHGHESGPLGVSVGGWRTAKMVAPLLPH